MRRILDEITGLSGAQSRTAYAIADMIRSDGTAPIANVLSLFKGADPRSALRQFKIRFNKISRDELELVFDGRKRSSIWFTGIDSFTERLSELSETQANRHSRDKTVEAYVIEDDLHASHLEVYISFTIRDGELASKMAGLIEQQLRARMRGKGELTITRSDGVLPGDDRAEALDRSARRADVALVLISPEYLEETAEHDRILSNFPRPIIVKLKSLPDGASLEPFDSDDVAVPHIIQETPSSVDRIKIAQTLVSLIGRVTEGENDITLKESSRPEFFAQDLFERARLSNEMEFVTSNAEVSSFKDFISNETLKEPILYHGGSRDAVPAVDRLVEWVNNQEDEPPRLCALLGDLGTGKTTTSILLTRELLAQREAGQDVPLPIYFDLRDLDVDRLPDFGLRSILEQMLRQSSPAKIDVDNVLEIISTERCLVIFDGLDEVLVHLDQGKGQKLTRGLLQVIDPVVRSNSTPRLMLTCRSQYFRSVKDEISFFSGQNRERIRGEDYLVLIMLPFNEEQILEYLKRNVPGSDPHRLLDAINSVHDLRSLAQQPVLLTMIREVLPDIEESLMGGHHLHSVDLYEHFIDRWLERDDGKHTLLPAHKHRLMARLAHDIWISGRRTWSAEWMENWLLEFLHEHPEMERDYSTRMPTQWKQDFRTATFISRRRNDFAFSHSSFLEYFLAKDMTDALLADDENETLIAWDVPRPSQESLIFLGEMLDGLGDTKHRQALNRLTDIAHSGSARVRATLLSYLLIAKSNKFPAISTQTLDLSHTDLRHWKLGSEEEPLDFTGVQLTGAKLDDAVLTRVQLNHANMIGASFLRAHFIKCSLIDTALNNCNLSGTIFRFCDITRINIENTKQHRTQLLFCHPLIEGNDTLIAPTPNPIDNGPQRLTIYPSPGRISCVKWDSDGSHILTAGTYGVRVWDAATGETIHTLTTDRTDSVAWSPDGAHILTIDKNNTRMWDAATGETIHTLTTDRTDSVAWSPDGAHILTAGYDGVRVWDAATGETIHTLTTDPIDHIDRIIMGRTRFAWSPDGARILTAGSRGARMWDAATGQPLGVRIDLLPEDALVMRDAATLKVIGASSEAWRWLGYEVMVDGQMTRLPAEINGPLPPLPRADS